MKTEAIHTAIATIQTAMDAANSPGELAQLTDRMVALLDRLQEAPQEKLMSVEQIAEILHMSPATITRRAREGKIPFVAVGNKMLFDEACLRKFVLKNTRQANRVWRKK